MKPYIRRVYYYETDKMAIVHHSNYIRWMEEARLDFMRQAGLSYAAMEETGIIMPVTEVSCKYRHPVSYDDEVKIYATLVFFNGVRAKFHYGLCLDGLSEPVVTGESGHCFLDEKTRLPVSLRKHSPEFYRRALELVEEETDKK